MDEIIKLQIRTVEVKLTIAQGQKKLDLEAKLKELKEKIGQPIVPIFKENRVVPNKKRNRQPAPVESEKDRLARIAKREERRALRIKQQEELAKQAEVEKVVEKPKEEVVEVKEEIPEINLELETKVVEAKVVKLPTVEEVEKEIEELLVPQPGEVEFEEKESESKQVESDEPSPIAVEEPMIGGDKPSNEAEVEDIVEEPKVEIPVIVPPVIVTETTTKKPVRRRGGRPKGSTNKPKTSKATAKKNK